MLDNLIENARTERPDQVTVEDDDGSRCGRGRGTPTRAQSLGEDELVP